MFNQGKITVLLLAVCLPVMAQAATGDLLRTAASENKVAFVLVTEPGAAKVDQARQMIENVMAQLPASVMIESNRADAAEASFVKEYQLATAPVPMIFVFASNGVMAGGNPSSNLTAAQLLAMVPSPKKAQALKAIGSGQAVYITASRSGMALTAEVAQGCAAACAQLQGKGLAIEINMDDPEELEFLNLLGVDLQAEEPVTVVINVNGDIIESFTGPVAVNKLVNAATKVVASSCCPPNSGKTCPPSSGNKEGK